MDNDTIKPTASRAQMTREQLLRAAEQLFAERGIANTPTRTITQTAGQRNESALHYHFGGRDGLISALHAQRTGQLQIKRLEMLHGLLANESNLPLRQLCEILVAPLVELAREDEGFVNYLKIIGEIAFNPRQTLTGMIEKHEMRSLKEILPLIHQHLAHLPDKVIQTRMDTMTRFIIMSMSRMARDTEPFQGPAAMLYLNNIIDSIVAMLSAEASVETREWL